MKTIFNFLGIMAVVLSFVSCDKEIANIDVNTSLGEAVTIHIDQTDGEKVAFETVQELSIDNVDTHDYLDKLKDVKINRLAYHFQNFSGDEAGILNASFIVDNVDLMTNADLVVKQAVDGATIFEITDATLLSNIAAALMSNQKITAGYAGDVLCDDAAMDFDLMISLDVTITANPL